ncbi:hypothetical protein ACMFMF_009592 [Clarireedia jacksonii]
MKHASSNNGKEVCRCWLLAARCVLNIAINIPLGRNPFPSISSIRQTPILIQWPHPESKIPSPKKKKKHSISQAFQTFPFPCSMPKCRKILIYINLQLVQE